MLTENEYNLFYEAILSELEPILVGPRVVAKADSLPLGIQSITINELKKLKGRAKRGQKGAAIPREVAEFERKTVSIIEHAYGFHLDDQDLLASRRSKIPLETGAARQCARIVAESIEDMIFNGIPELGIKGIYKDASKTFEAPKPWNGKDANPYEDIVSMVSDLSENGRYRPKFMVLDPKAYYTLVKTNSLGISYLKMIEDAGIFPNGRKDIYMAPANANPAHDPIIPPGGGLIGDFGNNIAERYVQKVQGNSVQGDEEHYTDIYLRDFPMNSNNLWEFNVQTYQGLGVHFNAAFLKLGKLTAESLKS